MPHASCTASHSFVTPNRSSGAEAAAAAKAILAEVPLERLYYVQGGADAWQVGCLFISSLMPLFAAICSLLSSVVVLAFNYRES
jgi:hypothetical protein